MKDNQKLNAKVYELIDELETQNLDDDADTNELADILNSYMTDMQPQLTKDLIEENIEDLQIEDNQEIDLTLDEREILKQEDEDLTLIGDDTLLEIHMQDEALRQDLQNIDVAQQVVETVIQEPTNLFSGLENEDSTSNNDNLSVEFEESVVEFDPEAPKETTSYEVVSTTQNLNDESSNATKTSLDLDQVISELEQTTQDLKQARSEARNFQPTIDIYEPTLNMDGYVTEDFSDSTQTLISPTIMDIDTSDLNDEINVVDDINQVEQRTDHKTTTTTMVDEYEWNNSDQTVDLESFEKTQTHQDNPELLNTVELEPISAAEAKEFDEEYNKDKEPQTKRKFTLFDWFLVVVIVFLVCLLTYMLIKR